MTGIMEGIEAVQEIAAEMTPVPATFEVVTSASDLKARLEWGEPALTIIDVREREAYNQERVTGAISLQMNELVNRAQQALEPQRDIYVYGENDEASAGAAIQLHTAGFKNVAILRGGLPAWKAINGPTEGRVA
jgi:rhodanese-related sulfurtransferase